MTSFSLSIDGLKPVFGDLQLSTVTSPAFRLRWDDEISDYGYKCRTQVEGFNGPNNPPAVLRFAPLILPPSQPIGDYRVNISDWQSFFMELNNDTTGQKFGYWTNPNTAQFNTGGWPMMAYLGMCGNRLQGERMGDWFRFETLKPSDLAKAAGMTIQNHPEFIHRFTCVTWDAVNKVTKHILSTGTPRGEIFYPLITKEGVGYIPFRFVIAV